MHPEACPGLIVFSVWYAVLETRFGYEFVYNASRLPADRYTFRFRRGMTLEEVMGIVGDVAGNLSVCIDGGKCKIRQGRNVFLYLGDSEHRFDMP